MWVRMEDTRLVNLNELVEVAVIENRSGGPAVVGYTAGQPAREVFLVAAEGENAQELHAKCLQQIASALESGKNYVDPRYRLREEQDPSEVAKKAGIIVGGISGKARSR